MGRDGLAILVSGMLAGVPFQGGATWSTLQFVLGLTDLGHRVTFVEQLLAGSLVPKGAPLASSEQARYFGLVAEEKGLVGRAALLYAETGETFGLSYRRIRALARSADVVLNISGRLTDPEVLGPAPVRVYLDLDPGFTQLWDSQGHNMRFDGHTHFVSLGLDLGAADCPIPTNDRPWQPMLHPIMLRAWPPVYQEELGALTTVANWRSYGAIVHDGVHYGVKAHAWRPFVTLPRLLDVPVRVALAIHPGDAADLAALREHGWELVPPEVAVGSPSAYRRFVMQSGAEIGFAKGGYVTAGCGWFSDRTICYLASGKPVIVQDTGFGRFLPTGAGLLMFRTLDDILAAVAALRGQYAHHARAARALAEEHFAAERVLPSLLDQLG